MSGHDHTRPRDMRADLEARLDAARALVQSSLHGIPDETLRKELVPGRPSMLGIARHTAFVEAVWFGEAITGRPRKELGVPTSTAASWNARKTDTAESVARLCREVQQHGDENLRAVPLDEVASSSREMTTHALLLHVLDELSWNTGQLDMLRSIAVR